jgi:hypothetical protein
MDVVPLLGAVDREPDPWHAATKKSATIRAMRRPYAHITILSSRLIAELVAVVGSRGV